MVPLSLQQPKTGFPQRRGKRLLRILLQSLCLAGVCRLVDAQGNTDIDFDADIIFENNSTLTPTLVDPESSSPTPGPSSTWSPTDIASDKPSHLPSQSPTNYPTVTISPSLSPTTTYQPSHTPSVSPRPSSSRRPSSMPSASPTNLPSHNPTSSPSAIPTISAEPTISAQPSISFAPSLSRHPSDFPSPFPSDSPSSLPTLSPKPSTVPSDSPSEAPSISMLPSMVPSISHAPTVSMKPSTVPSQAPSPLPSHIPTVPPALASDSPSTLPTFPRSIIPSATISPMPTLTVYLVLQDSISMSISGMNGVLTYSQQTQWEKITENHMTRFYDEINERAPGIFAFNVSRVHSTAVFNQTFDQGILILDYLQVIEYGLFEPGEVNEEQLRVEMFVLPFQKDSQSYSLDLITSFGLAQWAQVENINVGSTNAPTSAPTIALQEESSGPNLTRRTVRVIATCIVLSSVFVVAFLFWDRHRKEKAYLQTHANDFESTEYDNAGQANDWRNPYSPTTTRDGSPTSQDGSTLPQDRRMTTTLQTPRSSSPQTTASTVIAATPPGSGSARLSRTSNSLPSIPPKDGSQRSSSGGIGSHALMVTPPPPPPSVDHARHVSVADTEITDLTYSDGGGGGRSDTGSDGVGSSSNIPMLPTISNERYNGHGQFSSLEIPEEEPYSVSGSQDDDMSNPDSENLNIFSMSGFQMEVQELE